MAHATGFNRRVQTTAPRVHTFLADVPLHNVWVVELPRWRARVTLQDFLRTATDCPCTPPPLVRMLLDIRFSLDVSLVGIGTQRQLRGKYWQHVLPTRIGRIQ